MRARTPSKESSPGAPLCRHSLGEISSERLPGSASLGATPWERLPGRDSLGETLWKESLRARPPRYPELLGVSCMTFYRLLFRLAFQLALERHFFALDSEKPPKMEPKPSQNRAQNASEIDLMLRTLKSDFEQTLPHFCSFLAFRALQKSSQNRLKNSIPLTSSKKWYKKRHFSDFRLSWLPNWLQHGSPKLAQNRPKTWQIVYKSVQAYKTLPKWPQTSKNIQKSAKICKNGTNMAATWSPNSAKIRAKSVSEKSESEQTLQHICSFSGFQGLQKSSQNIFKNSMPFR